MFKSSKKKLRSVDVNPLFLLTEDVDPLRCVFGQPLALAAERSDPLWKAIPSPIAASVTWLNQYGLRDEGLYRVPGNVAVFATYKALFDRGVTFAFSELQERSSENVAMVIIRYLQALPEPIYTKKYEAHVKLALNIADRQERGYVLQSIMYRLPMANRETIRVLSNHLRMVVAHADKNRMTARNVEITWSLSVGQSTGALMKVLVESEQRMPSTLQFFVPFEVALSNSSRNLLELQRTKVPAAVSTCINWLLIHESYKKKDIIMVNPDFGAVSSLVHAFNCGSFDLPDDLPDEKVATLLLFWVQSLPESGGLIPSNMAVNLASLSTSSSTSSNRSYSNFEKVVRRLPESNLETIKVIISFLRKVFREQQPDCSITRRKLCSMFFKTKCSDSLSLYSTLIKKYDKIFQESSKNNYSPTQSSIRDPDLPDSHWSDSKSLRLSMSAQSSSNFGQLGEAEEPKLTMNTNLTIDASDSQLGRSRGGLDSQRRASRWPSKERHRRSRREHGAMKDRPPSLERNLEHFNRPSSFKTTDRHRSRTVIPPGLHDVSNRDLADEPTPSIGERDDQLSDERDEPFQAGSAAPNVGSDQTIGETPSLERLDRVGSGQTLDETPSLERLDRVGSGQTLDETPSLERLDRVGSDQTLDETSSLEQLDRVDSDQIIGETSSLEQLDLVDSDQTIDEMSSLEQLDRVGSDQIIDETSSMEMLDRVGSDQNDEPSSLEQLDHVGTVQDDVRACAGYTRLLSEEIGEERAVEDPLRDEFGNSEVECGDHESNEPGEHMHEDPVGHYSSKESSDYDSPDVLLFSGDDFTDGTDDRKSTTDCSEYYLFDSSADEYVAEPSDGDRAEGPDEDEYGSDEPDNTEFKGGDGVE